MPTILDIARKANVSITTVSRVINNSPHKVNPITREKVLRVIKELDYRPNAIAKSLINKKTMSIGVIIPDISNPYYAEIVRGIQDLADQKGYTVILQNTDRRQDRIIKYIYLLREKSADGIIFSGGTIHEPDVLKALKPLQDHVVVIGRHKVNFPSVRVDNINGAIKATQHLIDLGHKDILFIGGPDKSTTAKDRLKGYLKALKNSGYQDFKKWIRKGDFTITSGYILTKEILLQKTRPTAIFAANDQMAFGAIKAIKEKGLKIPKDIAVVGFDNLPLSLYIDPPLTTVEIPMYDLGYSAMEILINLLSKNKTKKIKLFKTRLIIRESTIG